MSPDSDSKVKEQCSTCLCNGNCDIINPEEYCYGWTPKNGDPSFFDCDAKDPVPDSKESGYPDGKKPECFGAYYQGPRCDDCPLIKECVEYENSDEDDCPDCPDRDDCHQQCEQYTGGC